MKKKIINIILIALLLSVCFSATVAQADSAPLATTNGQFSHAIPPTEDLWGNSMMVQKYKDGSALRFAGMYFGGNASSKISFNVDVLNKALATDYIGGDSTVTDKLQSDLHEMVNYVDSIANTQYENSDVYRFNHATSGQTIAVSDMTAEMITFAQQMYDLTDGSYNPAVYRLVDLWGFSSRVYSGVGFNEENAQPYDREWTSEKVDGYDNNYYPLPDTKYIDAFTSLSDFSTVELSGTTGNYKLTKNCKAVTVDGVTYQQWIDLGGIAKGYAAELAEDIVRSYRYTHYYINSGTSSMIMTSYEDGRDFSIGLSEPIKYNFGNETYTTVKFSNSTLSTSGLYNRYYSHNGTTYSHIIDGKLGTPVTTNIETVSVIGGTAWANDCLTTALTVMGNEKIVEFMNDSEKLATLANLGGSGTQKLSTNDSVGAVSGCIGVDIIGLHQYKEGEMAIFSNVPYEKLEKRNEDYQIVTRVKFDENGNRETIAINATYLRSNDYTWVYVVSSLAVVAVIGVIVYKRFHYPKGKMDNVNNVRKGKLFNKSDVLVYAVLIALIVVLFFVFVFSGSSESYSRIEVVNTITDDLLFYYDTQLDSYQFFNDDYRTLVVTEEEDTIIVTIYDKNDYQAMVDGTITNEQLEEKFLNILYIDTVSNTAKMQDSHCGIHQDCVHYFPAITEVGQTIICSPNYIKVVGLGE